MRRVLLASFAVAAGVAASAVPAQAASADAPLRVGHGRAIPGQYIVVLDDGADGSAVARRHGVSPQRVYSTALSGFAARLSAAEWLNAGEVLSPALAEALLRGTSIGGARPKALLHDHPTGRQLIAKFEVASDPYPVVKAEAVAMDLARRVGLNVAHSEIIESQGKSVLLVERFDRVPVSEGKMRRRMLVSALTLFGLDEMAGRYVTYHGLAEMIRQRFTRPETTLRELFGRIVFNICVSNTDDHARNHAAFYHFDAQGIDLTLTPGYDICPQIRSGDTADQALAIDRDGRRASRLQLCVQAAPVYQLTSAEAREIIDHQVSAIEAEWADAADKARLTAVERARIWRRQILNPAIHYDL